MAPASAQIYYFQEVPVPADSGYVFVGGGPPHYDGADVVVRGGQQNVALDAGSFPFRRMKVRVNGGAWTTIYQGPARTGIIEWTPPSSSSAVEVELYRPDYIPQFPHHRYSFNLAVVPPAQRAFVSREYVAGGPALKHTILVWQGGSTPFDKLLLVVEGIDGANENDPGAYYALGARRGQQDLFPRAQAEGADIAILNLGDGGRDLRANAAVVREAVLFLRTRLSDPARNLDVAGVSMGGVLVRYALAQMEDDGVYHFVGRFVSIDAPQQGAVIHGTLQHDIKNRSAPSEWPPSLARMAGRQLLQYNAFDTTSPTEHVRFFEELRALNGGRGYPVLSENIGVSFGAPGAPDGNPGAGGRWARLNVSGVCNPIEWGWPDCNDHDYHVVGSVAQPGSYLPEDITQFWGTRAWGLVKYELQRFDPVHPTFIPYASALDIGSNGQSAFAPPLIRANTPFAHDIVPPEIVGPLLNRLGYELPPPTSVSISGPLAVPAATYGTWRAVVPNPGAGYTYRWQYRIFPPGCSGGGGPVPMGGTVGGEPGGGGSSDLITCGLWHTAVVTNSMFTYRVTQGWLEIKVTATSGSASVTSPVTRVCGGNCNGREMSGGADTAGAAVSEAVASAHEEAPAAFAVRPVYPNPFGPGTSDQATIRFALPDASDARVVVYDALGREVARPFDRTAEAGWHEAVFDGSGLPGGVYVVRVTAGEWSGAQRVTLLR